MGILLEQHPAVRHFRVFHKRKGHYDYHRHRDARSIKAVIEQIKNHDEFVMNGRKSVRA